MASLTWCRKRVRNPNRLGGRRVISAGIVGGTGYTGVELLRLLASHPEVRVDCMTSRGAEGTAVADLFPSLRERIDLIFSGMDVDHLSRCDVVFFATPHGVALEMAGALLAADTRVIDLSADFRLPDTALLARWYGLTPPDEAVFKQAVYGLPEVNRKALRCARLVANPGCYPTAIQLGFLPLLEQGLIDPARLIASAASGASGAGRGAKIETLHCEVAENFHAYGATGHRHLPEIQIHLERVSRQRVGLTFVPHLAPMNRGIHATLFGFLREGISEAELNALYAARYVDEPFVQVLPLGQHRATASVRAANTCQLAIFRPQEGDTVVVLAVIDNLVKGAAGQAIQNMNLMFDLPETMGLEALPVTP